LLTPRQSRIPIRLGAPAGGSATFSREGRCASGRAGGSSPPAARSGGRRSGLRYSAHVYRPYFGWVWIVDPWPWGFWPWPVYNGYWWGPHARFGWYPGYAPGFRGGPRGHHGPGVAPPRAAPRPFRRR